MSGSGLSSLCATKCNWEPCPFQIKPGGLMCNKSIKIKSNCRILGAAQSTFSSNKRIPSAAIVEWNGAWDFLRLEQGICDSLFAADGLLLVPRGAGGWAPFREGCTGQCFGSCRKPCWRERLPRAVQLQGCDVSTGAPQVLWAFVWETWQ